MNIFEKLLLQLQMDAKNIEKKINEIEEENIKLEFYSQIREIIDKLPIVEMVENGQLKELLETGKITIENLEQIFEPKEEILYAKDSISVLKETIFNVNSNLKQLDIENMIEELTKKQLFTTKELEYIKNNLITLKETYEIVNNPNFNDSQIKEIMTCIKKSILNLLQSKISEIYTNLLKQTKRICDNAIIKNSRKVANKKYLQEDLKNIKSYLQKFSIVGIEKSFNSLEEMNTFFDYLKSINLDEEDILSLVIAFSKFNIDYFNNLKKYEDASMIKTIESNVDTITDSMESLISGKTIEETLEVEPFKLTEEEQKIYSQIKNLFEEKTKTIKIYDMDVVELLNDDFELKSREDYYLSGERINWDVVLTDVKHILEPNLENHKEQVFEIFKYIIKIYEKELEQKLENDKRILAIEEMSNTLQEIIISKEGLIKQYKNLTDAKKEYYLSIYNCIRNKDIESATKLAENISKPIEQIYLICILNELISFKVELDKYLEKKIISEEYLKYFEEEFNKYISEYQKSNESMINYYNDSEAQSMHIESPKNLIYFMEDDFSPYSEEEKKELNETVKKFLSDYWEKIVKENRDNFFEPLWRITPTGERDYYKNEKFRPYRTRSLRDSRTGILKIDICEENKEKIRKRYGIDKIGPLITVIGAITTIGSDHSSYDEFTSYIKKNQERINNLVELCGNPNSNEEELFEIIDKAFEINEQVKNGKFLGGASLK